MAIKSKCNISNYIFIEGIKDSSIKIDFGREYIMNEYSRLKRAMRFYEEANLEKLERATTQEEREKRSKRVEAIKKCREIMADVK